MKSAAYLSRLIRQRKTLLIVGLDTDIQKLPASVKGDVLAFNRAIIAATHDTCIGYKINFAFYESLGSNGWDILEKTIQSIPPELFIIADAKRGDIGNTSEMYARSVFDHLGCDAITVSPYMGSDSVKPFYREGKWVIILGLTSNAGSVDFQKLMLPDGGKLYEKVMATTSAWGSADDTMFVIGATHPDELRKIRAQFPDHFFLVPGVGAQGGDIDAICHAGINHRGGLLINASRSILYASGGIDFAEKASEEAERLNDTFERHLTQLDANN